MEEKLEAKTKYKVDDSFGDRINFFFSDLVLRLYRCPLPFLKILNIAAL